MATNRIKVRRDGDKITITSNDPSIKQVFFEWGSWGTGSGNREYPEFYGRSIERQTALQRAYSVQVPPDQEMWQWDLTEELVKHLHENIMGLGSEEMEPAERKANSDVLQALAHVLNNELPEVDSFTEAYITAALWSTLDNSAEQDGREGEHLDDNFGIHNIAPEAMKKITKDCAEFQEKAKALLEAAYSGHSDLLGGYDSERAGHDFWLTRNGHGVGFWDRGLGETGKALTKIAKSFGECWIEVGDDEQLHGF